MEWIIGGGGSGCHPKVSHIRLTFRKGGGPHVQGVMIALVVCKRAFKLVQLTTLLTEMESYIHKKFVYGIVNFIDLKAKYRCHEAKFFLFDLERR